MPETYHGDLLTHLFAERNKFNDSIDTAHKLQQDGDKYTATAKTDFADAVQSAHTGCTICESYLGNAKP